MARGRSNGTDRSASGPTQPANARHVHRRAIGAARFLAHFLTPTPRSRERLATQAAHAAPTPTRARSARRRLYRRQLALRLSSNRTVPAAIALIVVIAAGASLAPGAQPVGAAQGAAQPAAARLVIGGGAAVMAGEDGVVDGLAAGTDVDAPTDFIDDGTLYKPVAVDTTVESGSDLMRTYTVKSGDTLTGIASRFGVSMMTLWWANKITSKDALHVGQTLIIPPVSGLVYTVQVGDTLDSVAAENKVDPTDIMETNGLTDTNLIVGQVLVLPGAKGDPIPTPTPTKRPSSGGSGGGGSTPKYTGGSWAWPVIGGGNYISQYFHYGHMGVDIAASYGSPVVAARGGRVTHAGWSSTGCGYEVTISIGSNIYTTYCHNSRVLVSVGQSVSKGQQIAKVGATGNATGPHVHFAVSIGYPFESGSYFVNPLRYY
ncbi:MAG TPA: LysM peptidoglycan-binding domain-containing protein [Candidatus Limnocylindrales bacterium]|nr:LysM peptidoglycan-binding domain-containing protein [Candidatus Limnocylindrales bacterium]